MFDQLIPARLALGLALLVTAVPADSVGLGPMRRDGITGGPAKAFYLTLINNEPQMAMLSVAAFSKEVDLPAARVRIIPDHVMMGASSTRRLLVIASGLAPGETYDFRVCAHRTPRPEETIDARVCSQLTARRIAPRRA